MGAQYWMHLRYASNDWVNTLEGREMKLELIQGNRARLERELLLKIAARNIPESELRVLFAPLQRRAHLSIVPDAGDTTNPSALANQQTMSNP